MFSGIVPEGKKDSDSACYLIHSLSASQLVYACTDLCNDCSGVDGNREEDGEECLSDNF